MTLRRVMRINEVTGIMLECTDKTEEVDDGSLQETSFVWLPPAEDPLVKGAAKSEDVKSVRIPGYVWPQGANLAESHGYVGYWVSGFQSVHLRTLRTEKQQIHGGAYRSVAQESHREVHDTRQQFRMGNGTEKFGAFGGLYVVCLPY